MAFSFFSLFISTPMNAAARATFQLLQSLQVPVSRTGVSRAWDREAGTSSLYGIGKQLHRWNVSCLCLEVQSEHLQQLPLPFLAHLPRRKGNFFVVTGIKEQTVIYKEEGRKKLLPLQDFLKQWSGHVLLAEKTKDSGEKQFSLNRKKEKARTLRILLLIAAFLLCVLAVWLVSGASMWMGIELLLKLFGCIVSGLLLLTELDSNHPLAQAFCAKSSKGDCQVVLKTSKRSIASWSEIGLVYFGGGLLYLLLGGSDANFGITSWINAAALLFIPYSLYHQKYIAHAWCRLCLTVLALLLMQSGPDVIFYWRDASHVDLSQKTITSIYTCFLLALMVTIVLKNTIQSRLNAQRYRRQANRLQYDPAVFRALLYQQRKLNIPEHMGLVSESPDANYTVTQVCHPYCRPCARAHEDLADLHRLRGVRMQVIFTASNERGDMSSFPVQRLLALDKEDKEKARAALHQWYEEGYRDYEKFEKQYPVKEPDQQQSVEEMHRWSLAAKIEFTPTIFINGRQLPPLYRADDLRYLLDE
jgi:hypothetical protein